MKFILVNQRSGPELFLCLTQCSRVRILLAGRISQASVAKLRQDVCSSFSTKLALGNASASILAMLLSLAGPGSSVASPGGSSFLCPKHRVRATECSCRTPSNDFETRAFHENNPAHFQLLHMPPGFACTLELRNMLEILEKFKDPYTPQTFPQSSTVQSSSQDLQNMHFLARRSSAV